MRHRDPTRLSLVTAQRCWRLHTAPLRAGAPPRPGRRLARAGAAPPVHLGRRLLPVLALVLAATGSAGAPVGAVPAVDEGAASGATSVRPSVRAWQWPLPGRPPVLRRFDPPASPYGSGHRGVDLGGAPGDPVLAAGPGLVAYAGVLAGRGVVSVQHANGLRTTYEPLAVTVARGAAVSRGAVLGRLLAGHPGCPWPTCLHWGLRRGETYLDPLSLVRRGPVRLLPLHGEPRAHAFHPT